MQNFLSLCFFKIFSLNALDKVKKRSDLLSKTLCHFYPPPTCQNDTINKLSQNLLYFFLFNTVRTSQLFYFVLCVFLYIYRLESKSIFLFYNSARRVSFGFYGQSVRNDRQLLFAKAVCTEPFRLWIERGNKKNCN